MNNLTCRDNSSVLQLPLDTDSRPIPPNALMKSLFERLSAGERSAATEILDKYGDLVWAIVRKHHRSTKEAEIVTERVFEDIWKADIANLPYVTELRAIEQVTLRRLIHNKTENSPVI